MSDLATLTAVQAAPTRIAEILKAYTRHVASIGERPKLPMNLSQDEQRADLAASRTELADLKQRTLEDLQRFEQATDLALADERERLEVAILPVMSTDPHVQRVFELRQVKALARFTPLVNRAGNETAIDEAVRQFAAEAARQCDWATLRVLRTETAPALSRRGIDPATSEALRIIERTVVAVRPRAEPALVERRALDQGAARVATAFAQARAAVDQDEREVQILGYESDVVERVSLPVSG